MINHHRFMRIVYSAGRVLRVESAIIAGIGGLCLLAGWHSSAEIARAFLFVGALILVLSLLGASSGRNDPHCVEHQYVQATLQSSSAEGRAEQDPPGLQSDMPHLLRGVLLGGLTLGISWIVSIL